MEEPLPPHSSHPALGHLILLVFEAVMEVVCVSLPGYIVARQGMFDADAQKFVANLNVMLFTPCLIFTKLAAQLTPDKFVELGVIPFIFATQTLVSYLCALSVSKIFGFSKRPRNFVVAMGVFGNSNSLPISLVISLSQTLKGLHWDKIPGDNDNEVAARGILYLLIFQQLGQLVRWSWGYHVLLAPPDRSTEEGQLSEQDERYRDDPDEEYRYRIDNQHNLKGSTLGSPEGSHGGSGLQTPLIHDQYASSVSSKITLETQNNKPYAVLENTGTPANGNILPRSELDDNHITSFPTMGSRRTFEEVDIPEGWRGVLVHYKIVAERTANKTWTTIIAASRNSFHSLPHSVQKGLLTVHRWVMKFLNGLWEFMNPPLWAMLAAIVVASVPSLQRLFFEEGTFIKNSVTRAVAQSGGVAVPLILVVLGANLARNTLPKEGSVSIEDEKEEKKLLIAALVSRMLLPTIVMAPLLALAAKYIPISILDDPIFVIVCFLLTGAPSALQLAQICQINGVYMGAMSRLLFQSYVIWILPSTLILVMCALEVVEWAAV